MLDGHGVFVLHLREIRIVGGGQTQNIKIRVAAAEVNHLPLIGGEGDHIVGHPPDDIAEKAGVEHNLSSLVDAGGDLGSDAGIHIIAGDGQFLSGPEKQALQSGDGALG